MKKILIPALGIALALGWSCQSDEMKEITPSEDSKVQVSNAGANGFGALKSCASHAVLEKKMQENPALARKMEEIEQQTNAFIAAKSKESANSKNGASAMAVTAVNIPVIVHVIYSNTQQNISDAQIQSQISVLTNDFTAKNSEIAANIIPAEFASRVANTNITFSLAQVTRTYSTRADWGTNDEMKFTRNGGHDVIDPANHLNIWVCNIGGGILGYAQFPGGAAATDGVVVAPQYFGTTGYVSAPFNKGRTGTHEVGHWLNLRHIWGDGRCNRDDYVADTPTSDRSNYGCPSYPTAHCRSNDMTMNYMDYTDDACMYMFSTGQSNRMRALFAAGGARQSLAQ